jgi:anti-sigma factor RsiW
MIGLLGEYLDTALDAEMLAELEGHLADCAPCQAYLDTYRRTRQLTGEMGRVEMPEEMKTRLREFLLRRLGAGPA